MVLHFILAIFYYSTLFWLSKYLYIDMLLLWQFIKHDFVICACSEIDLKNNLLLEYSPKLRQLAPVYPKNINHRKHATIPSCQLSPGAHLQASNFLGCALNTAWHFIFEYRPHHSERLRICYKHPHDRVSKSVCCGAGVGWSWLGDVRRSW